MKSSTILEYKKYSETLLSSITDSNPIHLGISEILNRLNTNYFLIEPHYIDKDHLVDYTSFFARCHFDYDRKCKRVHFFSTNKESEEQLLSDTLINVCDGSLSPDNIERIQQLYLGFIVVKDLKGRPLIGKTCLKLYEENDKRFYPATRVYDVNLYGFPLKVKTMAFQSQDGTTGVCASIALWNAFQITGLRFQHTIPSSSEITKMSLSNAPHMKVTQGLDEKLMANGISQVGLSPVLYDTSNLLIDDIKELIYAYLKIGIPIIVILNIIDGTQSSKTNDYHAVTINGYSFEELEKEHFQCKDQERTERMYAMYLCIKKKNKLFLNEAHKITRFYAHDDQLCPFSRLLLSPISSHVLTYMKRDASITQSWVDNLRRSKIKHLIIPLPDKVRITYDDINAQVKKMCENDKIMYEDFQWEIFLCTNTEFKKEIRSIDIQITPSKESILKKGLPKYIWRAIAREFIGNRIFEYLFDSTESPQTDSYLNRILY